MKILLFYTDPGSGVMLLQILLAFVAGGLFYFRNLFKKLLGRVDVEAAQASDRADDNAKDVSTRV
jgi:hypothetical protein